MRTKFVQVPSPVKWRNLASTQRSLCPKAREPDNRNLDAFITIQIPNGYFTFSFGRLSIPFFTLLDGVVHLQCYSQTQYGHLPSVTLRLFRQSWKDPKVVGKETNIFQIIYLLIALSILLGTCLTYCHNKLWIIKHKQGTKAWEREWGGRK